MSIDLGAIEKVIESHMSDQPYSVVCSNCGNGLDCASADTDSDLDLSIKIDPCQACIDSAVEEAKEEMESNNE